MQWVGSVPRVAQVALEDDSTVYQLQGMLDLDRARPIPTLISRRICDRDQVSMTLLLCTPTAIASASGPAFAVQECDPKTILLHLTQGTLLK